MVFVCSFVSTAMLLNVNKQEAIIVNALCHYTGHMALQNSTTPSLPDSYSNSKGEQ